jgi:hypothetical protein
MSKCGLCGEDFGSESHQILSCKVDKYKESISLVLQELHDRLPVSNHIGFLAEPEVYEAMEILRDYISSVDEVLDNEL